MSVCHSPLDSVSVIKLFPRNPQKCNPADERAVSSHIAAFLSYIFKFVVVLLQVLALRDVQALFTNQAIIC